MNSIDPKSAHARRSAFYWGLAGGILFVMQCAMAAVVVKMSNDGHLVSSLSYENHYPYIFAREWLRAGQGLAIHNPFGSFDESAHLFHLYSILLSALRPLFHHFFILTDLALGFIFSFFLFYQLRRLLDREPHWLLKFLFFFGGGLISFFAPFINQFLILQVLLLGLSPMSFLMTSNTWILFQGMFLYGLRLCRDRKLLPAAAWSLLTGAFHSFYGVSTALPVVILFIAGLKSRTFGFWTLVMAGFLLMVQAFYLFYWTGVHLPSVSEDARYIKQLYYSVDLEHMYRLNPASIVLMTFFPLLLLALFLWGKGRKIWQDGKFADALLPLTALFIFAISLSSFFGVKVVPQPGRWLGPNLYWLVLAFLVNRWDLASALRKRWIVLIFAVAAVDSLNSWRINLSVYSKSPRESYFLNEDRFEIFQILKQQDSGYFAEIQSCGTPVTPNLGDFSYLLMAHSDLKALISHAYFTPHFALAAAVLSDCPDTPDHIRNSILKRVDFLLLKRGSPMIQYLRGAEEIPLSTHSTYRLFRLKKTRLAMNSG